MTIQADATTGLQTRTMPAQVNTRDDGRPGLVGIAVPWDTEISLWPGLRERIATDAVDADDGILFWRHDEPIGSYTGTSTAAGYQIDAVISDTTQGRDAATLIRDGAVRSLSIGFESLEHIESKIPDSDDILITHTRIRLRETSIVPHPAYPTAAITSTRNQQGAAPMTDQPAISAADLAGIRSEVADLGRQIATLDVRDRPAPRDSRSAGALLRAAILNGDATAVTTLERAYVGGTSADDFGIPAWAGDLTRIVEEADPLNGVFATGQLPETGMTLEFGRLKTNTVTVSKQAAEGDPLALGNVTVETDSVAVETYGGASKLTVQEIKRSQAPLLDMHFRAQAIAAGKQIAAVKLAAANALLTANAAIGLTVTGTGWKPWVPAIVNAVQHFQTLGLGLNGLLLPEAVWVTIAQLEDSSGKPLLQTDGPDSNVGAFNVVNLDGRLLQIPTRLVAGIGAPAFFNKAAIRHYTSALARVTNDLDALDLTGAFSVYQFGAIATEIPTALVPVTIA